MRGFAIALILLLAPAAAQAGPFGVERGMPLSKLQVIKKEDQPFYYEIRVPSPHPNFETYIAVVTPEDGLCKITGIGKTLEGDADGTIARSVFNELHSALSAKYGNSKDFDFLHANSIWNEPNEWAMSLKQNERSLASFWDREEHSNMPPDLSGITLQAHAVSSNGTYVNVSYEFSNSAACSTRSEASKNSVL